MVFLKSAACAFLTVILVAVGATSVTATEPPNVLSNSSSIKQAVLGFGTSQATTWDEQNLQITGQRGIDVSGWQHTQDQSINWQAVLDSGVSWVYAKCTDGSGEGSFTNWGPTDIEQAANLGIRSGCYHYAVPGKTSTDIRVDAINQAKSALVPLQTLQNTTLPLALDLEDTGGLNAVDTTVWAETFLAYVRSETNTTPWLYASASFLDEKLVASPILGQFPIWVAAYGTGRSTPPMVPPWARVVAWQFSSKGRVDGVGDQDVDLDISLGDLGSFVADVNKLVPNWSMPIVDPTAISFLPWVAQSSS